MELLDFYKGKRVLVTGDTGFKGSWLIRILHLAGAEVTGYALKAPTEPSMFEILHLGETIHHVDGENTALIKNDCDSAYSAIPA